MTIKEKLWEASCIHEFLSKREREREIVKWPNSIRIRHFGCDFICATAAGTLCNPF